jgi:hypothetical protein
MFDLSMLLELVWIIILAFYSLGFILFTKKTYDWMISHHIQKKVAVYYNRKLIHIFAGGVVVLAVPFVFSNPFFPLIASLLLGLVMFYFHKAGKILFWFQNKRDINDVTFCFMWGIAIFVLWAFFQGTYGGAAKWIAVIPPAFIAFGDGITGIVRNFAFKERRKHPIGNIYMVGLCIPIGYFFADVAGIPWWGIIAAVVASLFERYEFGPLDDNILITISSIAVLSVGGILGPFVLAL